MLDDSALRLLVLLVKVVLDHVLGTVHEAAERGPVLAMVTDPFQDDVSFGIRDLLPVQARLEVVVPPLTALLCVSGAVLPGDLDPVDLALVDKLVDQECEFVVLGGGPRAPLFAWTARALHHGAVACHGDGDTVMCGVGDNEDSNKTGAHQLVWQTCRGVGGR